MALDLRLLPHLSERALREEARARGIDPELAREALIEALRAHAERAPAKSASEAPSEPPAGLDEPIRTRTMAELLLSQGHPDRAARILRELVRPSPELAPLLARAEEAASEKRSARLAQEWLRSTGGSRVAIVGGPPIRAVVWRVDAAGIDRARRLVGDGAITLRIVRVRSLAGAVETERDERGASERGWSRLPAAKHTRVVASIGLAGAKGFASIAHAADR